LTLEVDYRYQPLLPDPAATEPQEPPATVKAGE
jgi:hypothetical protein